MILWLLLIGLLAPITQPPAKVMRIPADRIPPRIFVARGTILQFFGELPESPTESTIVVRSGSTAKASGSFESGPWQLQWDTSQERGSFATLVISKVLLNGQETRFGRSTVEFLEKPAFRFAQPSPGERTIESLPVRIASTAALQAEQFELTLDGKPLSSPIGRNGVGTVKLLGLRPGGHTLGGRALLIGGGETDIESVGISVPAKVRILPLSLPEPLDVRMSDAVIPLRIEVDPEIKPSAVEFFVNDRSILTKPFPLPDDQRINLNGLWTDTHRLRAEVIGADNVRHISADLEFQVQGDPKREFDQWKSRVDEAIGLTRLAKSSLDTEITFLQKQYAAYLQAGRRVESLIPPRSLSSTERAQLEAAIGRYSSAYGSLARACLVKLSEERKRRGIPEGSGSVRFSETSSTLVSRATERLAQAAQIVQSVGRRYGLP